MKSKVEDFVMIGFIVLFFIGGLWIGSELGDMLLTKSTLVRPKDWGECKIGIPLVIGIISGFLGYVAHLYFMAFIEWVSKKFNNVDKK